jgi:hypothetical protein
MKTRPFNSKRIGPEKPIQRNSPSPNQDESKVESLNLSPERISDGASTTTHLLAEILKRDTKTSHYRHWGINE